MKHLFGRLDCFRFHVAGSTAYCHEEIMAIEL
jgi:hypothetical protein